MSIANVTYAFVAGELSPKFHSRTDLSKYDLGVALAKNFFVDYQGGLSTRAGLEYVGPGGAHYSRHKSFRFRAAGGDYMLQLTKYGSFLGFYVIQNGALVLEAAPAGTISGITQADPAVVTAVGHSVVSGAAIYISDVAGMTEINGRHFVAGNVTANTFTLFEINSATTSIDATSYGAYTSGGTATPVIYIPTTMSAFDFTTVNAFQWQNEMWITHPEYAPIKITYTDAQTWAIAEEVFGNVSVAPTGLSLTPSGAATAGVAFAVTTINAAGIESTASEYVLEELAVNYTVTAGSILLEWAAAADAIEYYVYRSLVLPVGSEISRAQELGYVGRAFSGQFTDNNIIPDFTKSPPIHYNPFARKTIAAITITAAGTGYAKSDVVVLSGGSGSGFEGYPVVNNTGEILGVVIVNGGENYNNSTTVSFTTSTGSGATATATRGPVSDTYPSVFARFQQRGVYAGSTNYPMTLWGSKPGQYTNFDESSIINSGDGYEFTLDSPDVIPIHHLIPTKSGLLVMTDSTVQQLRAPDGGAVSAVNVLLDPQAYRGVSTLAPVAVDANVIFTQPLGSAVYEMAYTQYANSFSLQDLSVLSSHLLGEGKAPVRMDYAEEPHKVIITVREDGRWLTLTYVPDQEVYAWTQHETDGYVQDVTILEENSRHVAYYTIARFIGNKWVLSIERGEYRPFDHIEDYRGLDCALSTILTRYVSSTLAGPSVHVTAGTGSGVTLTTTTSIFGPSDVGKHLYISGGKATITAQAGTTATLTFLREVDILLSRSATVADEFYASAFEYGETFTTVSGLWHLEGREVVIYADGVAITGTSVVNGTLDTPLVTAASKITVGLPYTCRVKTLPITSNQLQIEGKLKNVYEVALPLHETKGLSVGPDFNSLIPMKVRADSDWDASSGARNDTEVVSVNNDWDIDGVVCIEQSNPLPATLLGLIPRAEVEEL